MKVITAPPHSSPTFIKLRKGRRIGGSVPCHSSRSAERSPRCHLAGPGPPAPSVSSLVILSRACHVILCPHAPQDIFFMLSCFNIYLISCFPFLHLALCGKSMLLTGRSHSYHHLTRHALGVRFWRYGGVIWFVSFPSCSPRHNKSRVAFANLRWNMCKNRIGNRIFPCKLWWLELEVHVCVVFELDAVTP